MMDKKFYAIAVSAICAMNVYAGPVDVNKAQTMARKFIGNPVSVGASVVQSRQAVLQNHRSTSSTTRMVKASSSWRVMTG